MEPKDKKQEEVKKEEVQSAEATYHKCDTTNPNDPHYGDGGGYYIELDPSGDCEWKIST